MFCRLEVEALCQGQTKLGAAAGRLDSLPRKALRLLLQAEVEVQGTVDSHIADVQGTTVGGVAPVPVQAQMIHQMHSYGN